MDRYINTPLDNKTAKTLKAGDYVYITGTIYTARDAAHKRMDETLNRNESLPIDVKGNIIYYMVRIPCKGRTSDRFGGSYNSHENGQIRTKAS